ncbi:hypothetical protein ART_0212 [Arthrobacter sp. PAMC 25486]|uniref:VOC family protein n=1 Tax=Arthrobacter sp. PAMC 25486 TaxID=1494608 RepID=UPI000535A182|nr:VOC family protein [Arthrobacter sp. PAMC 25486]AIX99810.1 hypothetical protein ART_0212 [Arthrobacter sp. PAMC 25486]
MIRLATIVINTENPATLANFWTAFMCTEVESTAPGFTWLKAVHGGPRIALQEVMYPSEGPRRLHMDFATDDVDTEVARAISLGATRLEEHTFPDFRWVVLADPDGNEFCIAPDHG